MFTAAPIRVVALVFLVADKSGITSRRSFVTAINRECRFDEREQSRLANSISIVVTLFYCLRVPGLFQNGSDLTAKLISNV